MTETDKADSNDRILRSLNSASNNGQVPTSTESLTDCELAILAAARARLETAQENYNQVTQTITRFYKLGQEDKIEMTTGEIQRGKKEE